MSATDPFRLGPALRFTEHPGDGLPSDGWAPLSTRIAAETLRDRVAQLQVALRSPAGPPVDARTAASTEHFGLVARLVAAHVCAASSGLVLDLRASSVWWRHDPGGWAQFSFAQSGSPCDPLQDGAISELTDRIQALYGVSPQILWGNIGSAVNSTITLLRASRPDLVQTARVTGDLLLADRRIDGGGLRVGPSFRRTSCCLIYRATGQPCGDCVLEAAETGPPQ